MGGIRNSAAVRRAAFVLFAGIALASIATSLALLVGAPAEHWLIAAAGVLCAAVLELTWVRVGAVEHRSPVISLPMLALPALAPTLSAEAAIGLISLGVLLAILIEAGRASVAFYSAGLQGAGGIVSALIYAGLTGAGLPVLPAVAAASVGYVAFVVLVEVLRHRLANSPVERGGRPLLSPVRLAVTLVGCALISVIARVWTVEGVPVMVVVGTTLEAARVLVALVIVATIVKVSTTVSVMRRRLAGMVSGASALSTDPGADAQSGATATIVEVLRQAVEETIGAESVSVRAEPARPGEISMALPLGAVPGKDMYIVARRDPMDGAFTGNDRRALQALATTAGMVVKARANIAGLTLRANTDPLTSLPNYGAFQEALANINDHRDYSEALAVLFIDIDDFKRLNDRFGHQVGDEMLKELGRRLSAVVRPNDVVARVGGDEFVVILTHLTSLAEAKIIAERILVESGKPVTIGQNTHNPVISVGLAYSAHRETDVNQLVQDADRSMLAIKKSRRRGGPANESSINISSHRSSQMNDIIAHAIDEDLLELAFQPIVSLVTGQIWAFEALVRYTHPDLGPLSPPSIVEKAKGLGRLDAMTRQVAVKAMKAAADFRLVEPRVVCMTINVEAGQILPERVGTYIEDLAGRYPGISLCLELNERSMTKVTPAIRAQADRLRDLGLMIALDDYGSQDSSVDALVRMPMDILKIDRSLVDDLDDVRQREVLTALQGFGDNLEYSMIVEGVENDAMADHLIRLGIRSAQGFHYGVPENFENTLTRLELHGARAVVPRGAPVGAGRPATAAVDVVLSDVVPDAVPQP
ncbi:EAL domain-containing protein [Cryobacterium sp. TMT1-21]|uniref:EAL domain-containing protein n=1 Tax=Cryobacterium shii TaxID=1259235 RepID=A0AAQ2C6N8_9MICO|nr:EAL domain-containing protein [Cryobacterium shii]TFD16287.1 EAL domain-containing protein [Cryobacterium sp. TMT4-10]TFD17421.1 EAL domain-containing protein [Cryobacterium sp. TMT1-21]TFD40317.1 EAL domain-containing protein [Cryobacterium sp. TMT2-10]